VVVTVQIFERAIGQMSGHIPRIMLVTGGAGFIGSNFIRKNPRFPAVFQSVAYSYLRIYEQAGCLDCGCRSPVLIPAPCRTPAAIASRRSRTTTTSAA
jgi:hypothetical protein